MRLLVFWAVCLLSKRATAFLVDSRLSQVSGSLGGASLLFAVQLSPKERQRKRDRLLQVIRKNKQQQQKAINNNKKNKEPYKNNICTLDELERHWSDPRFAKNKNSPALDYTRVVRSAHVQGATQHIGQANSNYTHPVLKLLHERKRNQVSQKINNNSTDFKVALCIEGGGMRGCVSAGMVCAIHYLNLTDTFDVVYGSSAGTIVGAYCITKQLPWFGPEVYYDRLTTAGRKFIDTRRLLRVLGLGLVDPRLVKDTIVRRNNGKPVLNLPYLLKTTLQDTKPLDFDMLKRQKIPLNVVTSGLKSKRSIVLNMENGGYDTLEELTDCMHASCLLPGIAGPIMNLDRRVLQGQRNVSPKLVLGNKLDSDDYEPLMDALIYEPLPYRTAIQQDNVTHCVIVRSRPDGVDVTGSGGLVEDMVSKRFFTRKNNLPEVYTYMKEQRHKKLYAEDVIVLNENSNSTRDYTDISQPHLMAMALPPGSPEVSRLETRREAIFAGLRRGFARAYDCLVEEPELRGKGMDVAKKFFPDEILDYDPTEIDGHTGSAFLNYMKENDIQPQAWQLEDFDLDF